MGLDHTFTFNVPVEPPGLFVDLPVDLDAWEPAERADRGDRAELVARVEAALDLLHAVELQLVEILAELDDDDPPAGP
jgi:hypothetical protein